MALVAVCGFRRYIGTGKSLSFVGHKGNLMGEESKSRGAVATILAALPSEVKDILSVMLLFVAFFAMLYTLINMPAFFKNLVSSSASKEFCWELKEVQSIAFKFNKCTGEAVQVEVKTDAPPLSGGNKK